MVTAKKTPTVVEIILTVKEARDRQVKVRKRGAGKRPEDKR